MPARSQSIPRAPFSRAARRLALSLCCAALVLLSACATAGGTGHTGSPTATSTPVIPAITAALVTYKGHSGPVIGAAWSPDGKQIASCGNDGTVQVWDAATGRRIWQAQVAQYVFALAWSPDGTHIAGGGSGGTDSIVVLDATTGHKLAAFGDQSGFIEGLAWSPDGKHIASGSADATVTVWNVSNLNAPVLTYNGHSDAVAHVAWSPDGTRIASASADGTVQVWDAKSGSTLLKYQGNAEPVWSVAWSPDGKDIASGTGAAGNNAPVTANNTVKVWNATTGQTILTLPDAHGQSYALAWSPDGTRLATSDGKLVRVWDAASGKPLLQFTGHSDDVFALAWSPDGTLIASASADGTVQVWRPQA